jgi:AmmeMemoRadiSam system protein B/AmmeMemoRadiSam system protein A
MEIREIQDKSQIPNPKSQINPKFQIPCLSGRQAKFQTGKFRSLVIWLFVIIWNLVLGAWNLPYVFSQDIKPPNVAGSFYPDNPKELSEMIDNFIDSANPEPEEGDIFALISPHAGYVFSGEVAAFGYKLIKDKPYKTVIVIGPSHYYGFSGISVYPKGVFRTPLGDLEIDNEFTQKLADKDKEIFFDANAFDKEHSIEVQLPFLQKALSDFKIVPIVMGQCSFSACQKLANLLKETIAGRKDVLLVISTDMYHGYDYEECETIDNLTLSYLKNMDAEGLYNGLREGKLSLCGGFPVVSGIILSKESGYNKLEVLKYTNSALVTNKKVKGAWTVGYSSSAILAYRAPSISPEPIQEAVQERREVTMLNKDQRKRLLEIARSSIESYLKTNTKLELVEKDPLLLKDMGAFVTLNKKGQLRGCIGNLVGQEPLYLTIRDMAIEAAVSDPRFAPAELSELKDIDIEISVLSPMEKISSYDKIQLGVHGVLVRKGFRSGVFLPQVATETGWSKEEFLSNLCAHKAGLDPLAWKDKSTEIYIFTAEVFSEKSY